MSSSFYRTALGKKAVMAVSGIVLFGFILLHMAGNLKLYLGHEAFNHYAEFLRTAGAPVLPRGVALWIFRVVLIVAAYLHIDSATRLTLQNRRARPVAYQVKKNVEADYAARTMRWGGVLVLLFLIYHLMHFTWGNAHPDFVPGDPYHNVVTGFSVLWVSLFYVLAQLALGMHLYHGLWSLFQSLGWSNPRFNWARRRFAQLFAIVVTVGNVSFPVAVLAGLVR